jgi:UDP-MurNAc hydroxylase
MPSKLSFEFIANACGIFTGKNGTKILCDPWLVDGVFDGSWCHFEKLKTTADDLKSIDALYISHLHPDHFDERNFNYEKDLPIIVLDYGPNFLIKKLEMLGYYNLIKIKNEEKVVFKEFEITLFSPFAKHNFHDATIGNLIDSAMLISCDGISALNANDNTPSIEAAAHLLKNFGPINLALLNYNAAGPYPSCFDNLSEEKKIIESNRVLDRNFDHLKNILKAMKPKYILPFAGAYVLGGSLHFKNKYLGTATWDDCAKWLGENNIDPVKVILLRENDIFDLEFEVATKEYVPINLSKMKLYIEKELSAIKYPYQMETLPNKQQLIFDIEKASNNMLGRMERFGIKSTFQVVLNVFEHMYQIYPDFRQITNLEEISKILICSLDARLLRNILDKKSHWNNAEIGAHIDFIRTPNFYEPDLHTGLQFFHI